MSDESVNGVDRPPLSDLVGVRYLGTSDSRTISAEDLSSVGVQAKGDLIWDADNGHFVPVAHMNAATVDYLAQHPDEFALVPVED